MYRRGEPQSGRATQTSASPIAPHQENEGDTQSLSQYSSPGNRPLKRNQLPFHRNHSVESPSDSREVSRRLSSPAPIGLRHTGYPLKANPFVHRAVQFYVKTYAPSANQRPNFTGVGQDLSLLRQYIPFILRDRMVFSAMVAMASLGADIAANGTRERSSETLKYYQLAVSMLRQRLTDESQRSSDAVVATLSNLCGFEAMSGRFDAVDMHTQGIRHVVTLRGGPDRLGFDGFLRTIAVAWLNFYASRQYIASHKESLIPADGIFTYPTHPFDPDLCSVIAKFPPGIMNIALSSQLSHQIIVMISRVNAWGQEVATSLREKDIYRLNYLSHNSKNITLSGQFLLHPNLSLVEQLLTLGLLGFCYSHDDTRSFYWITKAYLQVRCRHLNSVSIDVSDKNEDFMTWVGSVLISMGDPTSEVWILGLKLLDSRPTPRDWQANVNICETFFWTDSMSLRLSSKIGYLRQKRRV